jgi:putative PEP-CTERM system TPR-repeat lipoprotein
MRNKMNIRQIIITFLSLSILAAMTACGKSPEQHLESAKQYMQKADMKSAVIELKTVLGKQPDNQEARSLLGETYFDLGMYPDAEDQLERARKLGAKDEYVLPILAKTLLRTDKSLQVLNLKIPTDRLSTKALASLYATRAEAQLSLGNKSEAEADIETGKKADPNHPELLLAEAKLALTNNQKNQAEQLIDAALKSAPESKEGLYLKAALLQSDGKNDDALKTLQQIISNYPWEYRADLAIADLYFKKNDLTAADNSIKAAEKVAGKSPIVRYERGILEWRRGKLDEANTALQDVLGVAPNFLPAQLASAVVNYGLGHYEMSIKSAGIVLGAAPTNLPAAEILAGSLLKTGNINDALKTLSPLLPKYPDNPELLALAGEAYLRIKDYNKAMDYLNRAAELDPKNAMIKTSLAASQLAEGENDKALLQLEQAAKLSDKPGQADFTLVILYLRHKDYDQALQTIDKLEKKLPNNPVTWNLRGVVLLAKQDRAGARNALEQALTIKPDFLPAVLNLARLDLAEKKPDEARKLFLAVLEKDKKNTQAMLAMAELAGLKKNENEYLSWLQKALNTDPTVIKAREALIRYYLAKKQNDKAVSLAKEGVKNNPDNLAALNLLGTTQMATGDKAASVTTFSQIAQKAPQSPVALLELAVAQMANKQLDDARRNLEQALQLKPDFIQAQDALIRLELADKKPEAALQIAKTMQKLQPTSPIGYDHEADILVSLKRFPGAVGAYKRALDLGAPTADLIKLLGAMTASGDQKGANVYLDKWINQHPDDRGAHSYAAQLYMMSGRNKEAIAQFRALIRLNPKDAVALNNLAILYHREKDARAVATAEQALKLAPDQPGIEDTLGWILVDQGQIPRALDLLSKATSKLPKLATIHYHYGVALIRAGKKAEGKKELETAIATGQKFPELDQARTLLKSL